MVMTNGGIFDLAESQNFIFIWYELYAALLELWIIAQRTPLTKKINWSDVLIELVSDLRCHFRL